MQTAPSQNPTVSLERSAPASSYAASAAKPSGNTINIAVILFLVYIILIIKIVTVRHFFDGPLFAVYSLMVSVYILSRFLLAYFYIPARTSGFIDETMTLDYLPSITFVTPAKNEERYIAKTPQALLQSNYPKSNMEIIAINDGSTDRTLAEMVRVAQQARTSGVEMRIFDWKENRGKRDAMAAGAVEAQGELVVFVDSDSFIDPNAVNAIVPYFSDPLMAAVTAHGEVYNANANFLTRMQAVRYFVAFKAYKSAESVFGTVTCCSGCCSAYRRSALLEIIQAWRIQKFLGVRCTYGDDRALTNYLLYRGYKTTYAPDALVYTVVPETWKVFLRQQMRWKKSWTRESLLALTFMHRRHPVMAVSFVLSIILPFVAPVVALRALVLVPFTTGQAPLVYIGGLILMSAVYGLYYRLYNKDSRLWLYGIVFSWLYSLILVWQLPFAILKLRDSKWGTR